LNKAAPMSTVFDISSSVAVYPQSRLIAMR
jgi:hypothetical protein